MTTAFIRRHHFISGMPRAGSTLLAAILRQNPRFHAGMTSPVGMLFAKVVESFGAGSEFGPVVDIEQRRRFLKGLFSSYYADHPDKTVVFDTNRSWCGRIGALADLFPESRIICCVRNPAWVMDSIERIYRANPFETTRLFNDAGERDSVYSRTRALARSDRLVGFSMRVAKEALFGEFSERLLVLEYDLLVRQPAHCIEHIYRFIGEEPFPHDYDNVEYDAPEFDVSLGIPGMHKVRRKVSAQPRRTVLPPDLFQEYSATAFWNVKSGTRATVMVGEPPYKVRARPAHSLNE